MFGLSGGLDRFVYRDLAAGVFSCRSPLNVCRVRDEGGFRFVCVDGAFDVRGVEPLGLFFFRHFYPFHLFFVGESACGLRAPIYVLHVRFFRVEGLLATEVAP